MLFSSLAGSLLAAEISVNTDRNPVNLKESFQIVFTANDDPDDEPDFSPLDKDFEVLNQSQQQSVEIVNWKKTKSLQWVLTVMAKHEGNLVIPAIKFGQDSSQFAAIVVNNVQAIDKTNEDLFLQVEVSSSKPYIQEQVIYTLKLYRKVNISQASLTEPMLSDAVIEKLGADKNYNTQFQGENYVVTERKYVIFPQKSGIMTIAPLTMTAEVIIPGQRRTNSFFNRQSTRTKRVASTAINLDVQAKPASAGLNWLPAKQVYLQEKWSDNSGEMIVGQPVTRTITLFVKGATVGILPELYKDNMPQHIKAYPDQPVLKEEAKDDGMVAFREEKIALIPGLAGSYTLPEITIPWWNTRTQKMEMARIAERTITATAAIGSVATLEPTPPIVSPVPASTESNTQQEMGTFQQTNTLWFWLALFFAAAWLVTLVYFLSRKSSNTKKKQVAVEKKPDVNKNLKQACSNNDSIMAKDALLQWGREKFNQSSLTKIAEQCDQLLQREILVLNAALYSAKVEEWQGTELWLAFQNNKLAKGEGSEQEDPLQPLFKI
ncbi:BatD family protein [Bathymodiolus platifrons methanotrophic gill symbiont]|uniref:BatD family protein n=1 Tax=Bathymodiolus platifrons methanotrophic gill symbiont TaxID=113268 RepID=UPI001FCD29C2|nr:BatD family protein [Bathymodiolus platifrons methanotrophic gill symbiont]